MNVSNKNNSNKNDEEDLIKKFKEQGLITEDEIKDLKSEKMKNSLSNNNSTSFIDDLEKLSSLYQKGIITEKEFTDKKKKILGL
jgi:hypothetical protein